MILADIFDVLAAINFNLSRIGGGHSSKPKLYPRPNGKDKNVRKIGKGALPPDALKEWLFKKR